MKSKTAKKQSPGKGFFRKAGEVIGNIGHEIVVGKDKVVAASHNIIDSISSPEKTGKKKPVKKAAKKVATKKAGVAKKSPAKVAKKAIKKAVKKVVKKAAKAVLKK